MRRKKRQLVIGTSGWNRFVDWWFSRRIVDVLSIEPDPWRHAWYTDLSWDPIEELWTARVKPGFCLSATGQGDPVVTVPYRMAPEDAVARLMEEDVSYHANDPVDCFLTEGPPIPLPAALWRAVGTDAVALAGGEIESVPKKFQDLGVLGPTVLREDGESGIVRQVEGLLSDRANARLLRAMDLVLYHDRRATVGGVTSTGPDGAEVDFTLVTPAGTREEPYLEVERKFEPVLERSAIDLLLGEATDPGKDGIRIATLYLVSPPGAREGSDPDETWTGDVRHHQFWNLEYRERFAGEIVEPTRYELIAPGLGVGQLGAASKIFVDALNEGTGEVEDALSRIEARGEFRMAS